MGAVTAGAAVILVFALTGCADRYAAEVGYHDGGQQKWDIAGDYSTLDECRSAAIAQHNSYNAGGAGRAFSWACLLKDSSGGYESRHR